MSILFMKKKVYENRRFLLDEEEEDSQLPGFAWLGG
jgi:hypothetical protein